MTGTTSIRVEQVEETPVEDVKAPVAAAESGSSAGAMTTTDGVELRFMISSSAVEVRSALSRPLAPAPLRPQALTQLAPQFCETFAKDSTVLALKERLLAGHAESAPPRPRTRRRRSAHHRFARRSADGDSDADGGGARADLWRAVPRQQREAHRDQRRQRADRGQNHAARDGAVQGGWTWCAAPTPRLLSMGRSMA